MASTYVAAIKRVTRHKAESPIRSIQFVSFHGVPLRNPVQGIREHIAFDAPTIPSLHIVRDGNFIPPVVLPLHEFVVSEQVRTDIESFPGLRFVEVIFERLVDAYFAKGDFSIYEQGERVYESEVILNAPTLDLPLSQVGRYFEVFVPRQADIVHRFEPEFTLPFSRDGRGSAGDEPLQLSRSMLNEFSMFWHEGWHFLRGDLFETIRDYIDFDFFKCERVEF